jgi:uncharacterized protein
LTSSRTTPNRLGKSTSPYLLQHQYNAVDWYPWGPEALEKAKREDKPIFLSIGYAACHWCHVMEHESFEDDRIGSILNENFVPIKVDREQRPDLDQIYMQAVQMLTGSGGWPMSVFLTPDTKPFYGGTYWPPEARWGRPGFNQVLMAVADAWQNRREEIEKQGQEMVGHISESLASSASQSDELNHSDLERASESLCRAFDRRYGGFGDAPKFPHAMDLTLLMHLESRDSEPERRLTITHTLDSMAAGGIYDHLGGGFARYSVDQQWLVPHFEKMLYDNGLLAGAYLDAYRMTANETYKVVVCETLDYILRDMTHDQGGFYSSQDADSEGEEGKFYVWDRSEIFDLLGAEHGEFFCDVYGVSLGGNFEGHNILHLPEGLEPFAKKRNQTVQELRLELAGLRRVLLEERNKRIWPGLDDKVLVSWNALAIDAMARAGVCFDEPRYLAGAQRCAVFLLDELRRPDGRLWHVWRQGVAETDGFLDDYAYLINALVSLFQADQNLRWLDAAIELSQIMRDHFEDPHGGFFYTADDAEVLITRAKDQLDNSVPSGNGMAATAFARLGYLIHDDKLLEQARRTIQSSAAVIRRASLAAGQSLIALDWLLGPAYQCLVKGAHAEQVQSIRKQSSRIFVPRLTWMERFKDQASASHPVIQSCFEGRELVDTAETTMYICSGQTCQPPISGTTAILAALEKLTLDG